MHKADNTDLFFDYEIHDNSITIKGSIELTTTTDKFGPEEMKLVRGCTLCGQIINDDDNSVEGVVKFGPGGYLVQFFHKTCLYNNRNE